MQLVEIFNYIKAIDTNDPNYNRATGTFPLKERKDGSTHLLTEALTLGVRFHF